jgi:hypothetical protein
VALAKAVFMVIANAVLRIIAAQTAIFPIIDMDFPFSLVGRVSRNARPAAPDDE